MQNKTTPEIDNMYYAALEMCEKFELPKDKAVIDALTEMYRKGVVYAVKSMNGSLSDAE